MRKNNQSNSMSPTRRDFLKSVAGIGAAFAQEVAPSTQLKPSDGFTRFGGDIPAPNFMDYSLGGSYDFGGGVSLGAAVVGATKKAFYGPVNKSRVIVTLTKTL